MGLERDAADNRMDTIVMPRCKFNKKIRCLDQTECYKCAVFKKSGQRLLVKK